ITVSAAAAVNNFLVASYPSPTTAGVAHTFTVTARDVFGNTVTGYTGPVTLTSTDSQASFSPATYTYVTADAGVHTFSATLNTAGTRTLTATDTSNGAITGTSGGIPVLGLVVGAVVPTPTGFTAGFSNPLVNSSASPLNLYDAASASYGAADVTLVWPGGSVRGTLILDAGNTGFTFGKTGGLVTGGTTGLPAAGTYTVTNLSGTTGS